MNFKLIFAGLVFFLNFNVGIFDFAPDFIGCFLIMGGMTKLRDLDGRFEYSHRLCKYMSIYFAGKFFLSFVQRNYTLPLTFMTSVIEIIFLIVFFTNLFGAIEYTCQRHGGSFLAGNVIVRVKDKKTGIIEKVSKNVNYANRASITAFIFAIVKGVLVFIPESIEIFGHTDELDLSYNANKFSAALAKPPIMLLCYSVITIAAICFIVICGSYLVKISRDRKYIENLEKMYKNEVAPRTSLFISRSLTRGFVLIYIALFFFLDFKIECFNIIPDSIGFAFLIVSALVISNQSKTKKLSVWIFGIVGTALSAFNTYFMFINESSIKYKGTAGVTNASPAVKDGGAVITSLVGGIAEAVVLIIMIILVVRCIKNLPFSKKAGEYSYRSGLLFVSSAVFALCSAADNTLTLAKAHFALGSDGVIDDSHDFAHLAVRVIMYLALLVMIRGFYKLKEWTALYV